MFTGSVALPVSADAVIFPLAPTFTVATAKAPVPVVPGTFTMPSLVVVAAKATMSGTGVEEAESKSVFSPTLIGAGSRIRAVKAKLHIGRCDWSGGGYGKDKALRRTGGNIRSCVRKSGDLISSRISGLVDKRSLAHW